LHAPTDTNPAMGSFTVPSDAQPGPNVVIMTQSSADGKLLQAPIRAVVTVTANGSAAAQAAPLPSPGTPRANGLATTSGSVATGSLILVALGVAGIGIFLAGLGVFVAGRRSHQPGTLPVATR
jgi:hypothetical protein